MSFSAADIVSQDFPHYKLNAPWDKIIGKPAENASILMFSGPGSGKSTVALQMCDEFTRHGKTAFMVAEEGISSTFAEKLKRLNLTDSAIAFHDPEGIEGMKEFVIKNDVDVLCVDSFTVYDKRLKQFDEFRQWCKNKDVLFISIVQTTKDGKFYGNADAAFNVDCVIKVTDGIPSTVETGKNRLGELYEHDIDLREKPVTPVKLEDRKNPEIQVTQIQGTDNSGDLPYNRADEAWFDGKIDVDFKVKEWHTNPEKAIKEFNLKGIEFGNWLNAKERVEYLANSMQGLYIMSKILGVSRSAMGLNKKLGIAFGARGRGGALAHYEPISNVMINLTKEAGQNSLAHEWAHSVDNVVGKKLGIKYVTGGRSTAKNLKVKGKSPVIKTANKFFEELFFNDDQKSAYFKRMVDKTEYEQRRLEIFARTTDIYFVQKCKEKGYSSAYIGDDSFGGINPTKDEFDKVEPIITQFYKEAFSLLGVKSSVKVDKKTKPKDKKPPFKIGDYVLLKSGREGEITDIKDVDFTELDQTSKFGKQKGYLIEGNGIYVPASQIKQKYKGTRKKPAETNAATTEIYFDPNKPPVVGRYALIEAKDLIPSHNKDCSQNSKHLISKAQPRDRSGADLCNQSKLMAQKLNPDLITVGNKAFDGAPVTLPDGQVIQGNGRSIALKIGYDEFEKQAATYKKYLVKNAAKFGFTPAQVKGFSQPVLIREVDVTTDEAVRLGNIVDTSQAKMNRLDQAKAYVRQLDREKRQIIGRVINSSRGETLGEMIDDKGLAIMDQLKGLDRTGLVKDNALTTDGKDFIKQLFAGLVFDSDANKNALKHFAKLLHNTKAGIERSYGFIIPFIGTDRDISNTLQKSIEIVQAVQNSDAIDTVPDFLSQGDAFTGINKDRFSEKEVELAEFLIKQSTQKAIKEAFQVYYFKNIGRTDLLNPVEKVSADVAFADSFVKQSRINPPEELVKLHSLEDFEVGDIVRDYYDNEKYKIISKEKRGWNLKSLKTGKKEHITDMHGPRFLPNRDVTPTIPLFRANGRKKPLVHLGFVEQLEFDSDLTSAKGVKGNFFLFSSSDKKKLYIIPQSLVKAAGKTVDCSTCEKLYKEWSHFRADGKDLEITWPKGKTEKIGTAKKILYASDKVMQAGDKKGKINYYQHDFDKNKRPVGRIGNVLVIDKIEWDERGILN